MTTGNFADVPPPVSPPTPAPRSFRLPADYYASPRSDVRPMFASWVPYASGAAALVILLLLSVLGADISRNGLGKYVNYLLAPMASAIPGIYEKDVPQADRKELEAALATLREKIRANQVPLKTVQPVLQDLQGAIADQKLTTDEVRDLTRTLRETAAAAK